jgi:hypothetical protein
MRNLVKLGCAGVGVVSAMSLAGCDNPAGTEDAGSGAVDAFVGEIDAFVPEGVDAGPLPDAFVVPTDDTGMADPDAFVSPDAASGMDDCMRTGYPALSLVDVAPGYDWTRPVFLTHPPGSSDLYVVDARGFIYIVRDGAVLPTPFLDVRSSLSGTPTGGAASRSTPTTRRTAGSSSAIRPTAATTPSRRVAAARARRTWRTPP